MTANRSPIAARLPKGERRRSIKLAYVNAGLWGLGCGLTGMTLLFYLANEYQATPSQLSWVIAAPSLVGVLRLLAPLWMDYVGNRRKFCVSMFTTSALLMITLPLMSAPGVLPDAAQSIPMLIICWAGYNLFEHFAVVALWSWYNDLVPRRIRGHFVGRRAGWMTAGRVLGVIISAVFTIAWRKYFTPEQLKENLWIGFSILAFCAALAMLIAVLPLFKMVDPPSPSEIGGRSPRVRFREMVQPFGDGRFRKLLYYGWWFSFANGISETAIRIFLVNVLELKYAEKKVLDAGSRGLQSFVMPWAGVQTDKRGNVIVLAISQGLVAMALLFLLPATLDAKWWILGAYFLWVAYAGTNVAMPNLMLKLSNPTCSAAYSAAWFASIQLAYALSVLLGGELYEWATNNWTTRRLLGLQIDHIAMIILVGWFLRMLGVLWALRIREKD